MWTKQAILWLLSRAPTHGFKAWKDLRKLLHLRIANAQVTMACRVLREQGWAVTQEEWNGHKKRVIYSITAAGSTELQRWLSEPINLLRDDFGSIVRVLILLHDRAPRLRPELLDAKQELWTALQSLHELSPDPSIAGRAWLSFDGHRLAGRLKWIDDVLALLPDEPASLDRGTVQSTPAALPGRPRGRSG